MQVPVSVSIVKCGFSGFSLVAVGVLVLVAVFVVRNHEIGSNARAAW
jgi:hypothetical protein